jgi:hypothetical protein
MNHPLLIELEQKNFNLQIKNTTIEKQKNELEQQKIQILDLQHEIQHHKKNTDTKLELQEKMIENLKIELEVYITEIKKKMNGCKKKQESHSAKPINRNSKITSPVEMPSDPNKIPTNFTSRVELKTETIPVNNVIKNPNSIQEHELINNQIVVPRNCSTQNENTSKELETVNCISEIGEFELEKNIQSNEHLSKIRSQTNFRIEAKLLKESSQTLASENEMEIQSSEEYNASESMLEAKMNNKLRQNANAAKLNSSLTVKDSIEDYYQENNSFKKDKPFECKICPKAFQYKGLLKRHIETFHDKIKAFECKICSHKFGQKGSLKTHVDSVHNSLRPFECEICTKAFQRNSDLKRHVDTVHEKLKPFTCQICGQAFGLRNHLNGHINMVHKNLRPFKCTICPKLFPNNVKLKNHINIVHKKLKLFQEFTSSCAGGNNNKQKQHFSNFFKDFICGFFNKCLCKS